MLKNNKPLLLNSTKTNHQETITNWFFLFCLIIANRTNLANLDLVSLALVFISLSLSRLKSNSKIKIKNEKARK